jgi:hypothetical protein
LLLLLLLLLLAPRVVIPNEDAADDEDNEEPKPGCGNKSCAIGINPIPPCVAPPPPPPAAAAPAAIVAPIEVECGQPRVHITTWAAGKNMPKSATCGWHNLSAGSNIWVSTRIPPADVNGTHVHSYRPSSPFHPPDTITSAKASSRSWKINLSVTSAVLVWGSISPNRA